MSISVCERNMKKGEISMLQNISYFLFFHGYHLKITFFNFFFFFFFFFFFLKGWDISSAKI